VWEPERHGRLVTMAIAFDPTMAAFLRTMGVEEQNILAQARQQSDIARRAFTRQIPAFNERARSAVQGVRDEAETRGVFSSGATARNSAIARANVLREQQEALAQSQDTSTMFTLDAARQLAELRRRQAEATLDTGTRNALLSAQSTFGG